MEEAAGETGLGLIIVMAAAVVGSDPLHTTVIADMISIFQVGSAVGIE
jgi:hypothetical protein